MLSPKRIAWVECTQTPRKMKKEANCIGLPHLSYWIYRKKLYKIDEPQCASTTPMHILATVAIWFHSDPWRALLCKVQCLFWASLLYSSRVLIFKFDRLEAFFQIDPSERLVSTDFISIEAPIIVAVLILLLFWGKLTIVSYYTHLDAKPENVRIVKRLFDLCHCIIYDLISDL